MKKVIIIFAIFITFSFLIFSYFFWVKNIKKEGIKYPVLFSIKKDNTEIVIYSKEKKIDVGENNFLIKINPPEKIQNIYFYMPPMPGMGEMRSDVYLHEIDKGVYEAKTNITMAGGWQLIAVINGKEFRKDLNIPFEKEEGMKGDNNIIPLTDKQIQMLGILTDEVKKIEGVSSFEAIGYVDYDRTKLIDITLRFDGWIIDTFGRFEGEFIKKGTALLKVLSPDLKIAEEELNLAKNMNDKNLENFVQEKINYLKKGEIITSPVNGIILEKKINNGGFLKSGEIAYKIADISKLWIIAEIPLEYSKYIKKGMEVMIKPAESEEEIFSKVDYIFPEADKEAKTIKVRIPIINNDFSLKLNSVVNVYFEKNIGNILAVPETAVIDTGKRQIVFVEVAKGIYKPKSIKIGRKINDYYEVIEGLKEGDKVVVNGTFLLDSEAEIKGIRR